jgi:hypothetical protein
MFALAKFDPTTEELAGNAFSQGKTMCLIATAAGDVNSGLNHLDSSLRSAASFMKCNYLSLLIPLTPANPRELEQCADVKEQAEKFGTKIAT